MGPDNSGVYDANTPAVSYNATSKEYLVVWSGDTNAAPLVDQEFEIYGQRLTAATGADAGTDFRISDMGPDGNTSYTALLPAVATRSAEYLVVWVGDDDSAGLVDNQFEIFGQLMTFGLPTVSNVNSVAGTSGATLTEGESTNAAITQLLVTFSTSMNVTQAETEANYQLITDGGDGIFQTAACAATAGDDASITVDSATYITATRTVTLTVNGSTALPEERYRLAACPTLTDSDGNQLDGNADGTAGDAFTRIFRIDTTAPVLALPEDITVTATGPSGAVVTYSATATDNGGSVPVTCFPPSGSIFAIGTTTVNCTATDAAGNDATGSFTVTVVEEGVVAANLSVGAESPSIQVVVGRTQIFTFTVANGGPSAATGVQASATLPAGLAVVSATASQGTCSTTGTTVVNCSIGQLANGGTATITIVASASQIGAKNFTLSVTSATDDPVTANNSVNQTVTVVGTKVYLPLILR